MEELTKRYAELEEKLVELRNLSRAEVTNFLDDEIGSRLDKLSRQVARIDKRLYTQHEVSELNCSQRFMYVLAFETIVHTFRI